MGQGNMKWTHRVLNALENNRKAFTWKENPIPADKNQTLTKIERNIRKQGGGGALKPAPLLWRGKRLIVIRRNGVVLSSEGFAIPFQSI